jgi:hypothetical protein
VNDTVFGVVPSVVPVGVNFDTGAIPHAPVVADIFCQWVRFIFPTRSTVEELNEYVVLSANPVKLLYVVVFVKFA